MVETLAVGVSLSYYERSQNDGAEGSQSALWSIWSMVRAANLNHRPSTKLPRAAEGVPLDLDECGGRALVRRRLENGPTGGCRRGGVAREGARRPSRGAASHGRHWLFKVAFAYLLS